MKIYNNGLMFAAIAAGTLTSLALRFGTIGKR